MYLDYAEDQASRQVPMHMADWIRKLDSFLQFNERNILTHAGKVSAETADKHAGREFEKFNRERLNREAQEPTSDFDKFIEKAKQLPSTPNPKPKTTPTKKQE